MNEEQLAAIRARYEENKDRRADAWRSLADVPALLDELDESRRLLPAENMVLTVARSMIQRGDNPEINVTAALLLTIERLTGGAS